MGRRIRAATAAAVLTLAVPVVTAGPASADPPPDGAPRGPVAPLAPTVQRSQCNTLRTQPGTDYARADHAARSLRFDLAWRFTRGEGQRVAVIDTGVTPHPRLGEVIAGGDYVSTGDGRDDCDAHGTAVAGIIAGRPAPGDAFTGVAPAASIIAIRQASAAFEPQQRGVNSHGKATNRYNTYMGSSNPIGPQPARSAAVYARISSDPTGESLGVQRQLADCQELASSRGWVVAEEYVDNDVSAYSGKPRPAYRRMLDDLRSGARDAVIVYNLDRLHRQPSELEEFVNLCESAQVRHVATVTADIDLGNDDGLFMARIFAAFAAKESGRKSARITRKALANAHAGLPHGPARPFGYEADKVTIRESEAAVVSEVVARFLAGESLRSLTAWLIDSGVPTVRGAAWRPTTLGTMIRSPRIAGLREYKGEVVGDAVWPAIITPAQREQVLARFAARRNSGRRAPRKFLLSGLLRCGRCGTPMYTSTQHVRRRADAPVIKTRRYVCLSGPAHQGCGRVTIAAEPVERIIAAAVLARLDSPQLADALAGRVQADEELSKLQSAVDNDQARLDELAGLYADGAITAREWMTARTPIETRIRSTTRRIADQTSTPVLINLLGQGQNLERQWDELNLDRQHAIIRAVLDYATISPAARNSRTVALERVRPQWAL